MKRNIINYIIFSSILATGIVVLNSCDEKIEKPILSQIEFTYSGNEIEIEIPQNDAYVITGNKGTAVGMYQISLWLNPGYVWTDYTKDCYVIDWIIKEKTIEIPELITNQLVFNTHEQMVKTEESPLYYLSNNKGIEVGNYNAVVELTDANNYCWSDGTKEKITLPWSIVQSKVDIPTVNENLVYTGSSLIAPIEESFLYDISNNVQVKAGQYQATVSLVDKKNNAWSDGTIEDKQIQWSIEKKKIEIPCINKQIYQFNGLEQKVDIVESKYYVINDGLHKDAGTYYSTLSLVDVENTCWEDGTIDEIEYSWKIKKALLSYPELVNNELTFVNKEIEVSIDNPELYVLSGNKGTEIGDYTVTVSLKDKKNSMWLDGTTSDINLPWKIVRKGKVSSPSISLTYNGKYQNINSYSCYEYKITSVSNIDAGEYEAEVKLNYPEDITWEDGSTETRIVKWTIEKAIFDGSNLTIKNSSFTYDGTIKSIEVNGYLPDGFYIVRNNGEQIDAGVYGANIRVGGSNKNYELVVKEFPAILTINKADYDISNLLFESKEEVYDGREKTIEITGNIPIGIIPVYSNNKGTVTGIYNATVSFNVNKNYNPIKETLNATLTIKKGIYDVSEIQFNDKTVGYNGKEQSLSYSGYLPEGIEVIYSSSCKGTEIGSYTGTISFNVQNTDLFEEITATKEATLTIVKGDVDLSGISFESKREYYDKNEHILTIEGTLPEGVSVTYLTNTLIGKQDEECSINAYAVFEIVDTEHYKVPDIISAKLTVVPKKLNISTTIDGVKSTTIVNRYTKVKDVIGEVERPGYTCEQLFDLLGNPLGFEDEIINDIDVDVVWNPNTYHIEFSLQEGSLPIGYEEGINLVFDNDELVLPIPTHEDSNYEFEGWFDLKHKNYKKFRNGIWKYSYEEELNITLVGLWSYRGNMEEGISISADDEYITYRINNVGAINSDFIYLYSMNPGLYYYSDLDCGLSTSKYRYTESYIAAYRSYSKQQVKIPRYTESGLDLYTQKYYLAINDTIIKGPVWAVEVESKYDVQSVIDSWGVKSKKGLFGTNIDLITEANVNYGLTNMLLNGMIYNNEEVKADGTINLDNLDWKEGGNVVSFMYNGKKYFFDESKFKEYDEFVESCTNHHIQATLILLMKPMINQYYGIPYYLQYPGAYGQATYCGLNSSNERGADYYGALMSFIVDRYSNGSHGYVSYYVLGNEVDMPSSWNAISNMSGGLLPVDTYVEEYYRNIRILSQVIRNYNNNAYPLVSYSHFWGANRTGIYKAYEMTEKIVQKTNLQNNFDWGIASHSYPFWVTDVDGIYSDLKYRSWVSYSVSTNGMGVVNLEVYDKYLDRQGYYLPNGNIRPVVMTESGATIGSDSDGTGLTQVEREQTQAAVIAYTYFKVEMLKSIKAYIYYKDKDNELDGSRFGMVDDHNVKRTSYYMWKDIDTTSPSTYKEYIQMISYCTIDTTPYKFKSGVSYLDVIKQTSSIIGSNDIDWDSRWENMKERLGVA